MAKAKTVAQWFEQVTPDMAGTALALRDAINEADPGLACKLAWGFPCWSGNERIFSVIAHTAHCNLQLWNGAQLAAKFPERIEGTGKQIRHVKLSSLQEVDKGVTEIIRAAIKLDQQAPQKVR